MTYRYKMGGPAYGPRPSLALTREQAFDFVELIPGYIDLETWSPEKQRAKARFDVLTEDYEQLIARKIDNTHYDESVRADLKTHITLAHNIALDMTREICVVWKHDARRYVPDASDAQNEALRQLVLETNYHTHARSWNREAFFLGPVTVIPVMRGNKMFFDTLLPHFYVTQDDPDRPWAAPLAAAWKVLDSREHSFARSAFYSQVHHQSAIVLDGEAWRYYRKAIVEDEVSIEEISVVPHGLGEFPGATLSFNLSHGDGRWSCTAHQRLFDATVTVSYLDAVMNLIRKGQNQKLLVIKGQLDETAKGQVRHPEGSMRIDANNASLVDVAALDFNTDPENAIKHQGWVMQGIARSYGGQVASRPGGTSQLEMEITFSHDALTEQRNEQIPFALEFERELWAKTVRVARQQRHPLADDLPDSDAIRESLIVEFPPLARRFDNIDAEIKYNDWALSKGIKSLKDVIRPVMPHASDEQCQQRIADNLDSDAPLITKMTTRDQSMAPTAPSNETESQINGARGPEVRDSPDNPNEP